MITDPRVGQRADSPQAAKTCKRCRETKPETAFHRDSRGERRKPICAECRNEVRRLVGREKRNETPEQGLRGKLWRQYKLTLEQFTELVDAQSGVCAICGKAPAPGKRLFVDHCHATGVVRALLCLTCNLNVGVYENHHRALAEYLATYGRGNPLLKP
jgi:hypothetical protein